MNKGQRPPAKRGGSPAKRRSSSSRSRLSRADMAALEQLDRLLEQQRREAQLTQKMPPGIKTEPFQLKRLSPQDLPPSVRTDALQLPGGGRVYFFVHERLGVLGNLILSPAGRDKTQVSVELAPGDPDAPAWTERYELFNQVATICLNALPGGDGTRALPSLEDARAQQRLYQQFIACQHSIEMFGLDVS